MLADGLSIAALVVAVASLGWQMLTWRQGGPVVAVTATQAFPTYGHGRDAQIGDPHVNVNAANKGRSPITVKAWGLRLPDGRTIAIMDPLTWSTPLPHRLEPGADASWYVETNTVKGTCEQNGVRYQDLIAYVTLGDGRTIEAQRTGIGWK